MGGCTKLAVSGILKRSQGGILLHTVEVLIIRDRRYLYMIQLNFELAVLNKFAEVFNLLDAMLRISGMTAYANVSSIGKNQATLDIGHWLNELQAEDLGRTRPYTDGGSRAPMVARLKSGELVIYHATAGAAATPIVKPEDRGSGWQGGVGDVEWAVGVSALAEQCDKLIAAIAVYYLVYGGFELVSVEITPATENEYQAIYRREYKASMTEENQFQYDDNGVRVTVIRPAAGQSPICKWGFGGPGAESLIAFLQELEEGYMDSPGQHIVLGSRRSDEMYDMLGAYCHV